jgi:hypothetical protein
LPQNAESCEINAAEKPIPLVRRFYRHARKLLKSIIDGMDLKYLPGSCCG